MGSIAPGTAAQPAGTDMPADNPRAHMTIGEIAARGARLHPDDIALRSGERVLAYRDLEAEVRGWAVRLADANLACGDRIAVWSDDSAEALPIYLAVSLLGVVAVPLNARWSLAEAAAAIADSGARVTLLGADFTRYSGELSRSAQVADITVGGSIDRDTPPLNELRVPDLDLDAPFLQFYTSGTTGKSKGCMQSQSGWLATIANLRHAIAIGYGDRVLCCYSHFHTAGLAIALAHLSVGAQIVMPRSVEAAEILQDLDTWKITSMFGMPKVRFRELITGENLAARDLSSLRKLITGSGILGYGHDLHEKIRSQLPGVRLFGCYGSSETGNYVSVSYDEEIWAEPDTYGRPLPAFDVRICDDDGRPVPDGEIGELLVRGASTMLGYWNLPEASAETLDGGWVHTGDLMRLSSGRLYYADRKKDMIKSGGENIYSVEVEQALLRHPEVREAAVVGVPDARWGETVKAVIVSTDGAELTPEELDAHCLAHLSRFKRPRQYEFVDSLPKQGNKVAKARLRALGRQP